MRRTPSIPPWERWTMRMRSSGERASNIRVLVELDAHASDLPARARLWLAHGVAGFRVPGATAAQIADLKKSASSFAGQRVVIGDVDSVGAAQMVADPRA